MNFMKDTVELAESSNDQSPLLAMFSLDNEDVTSFLKEKGGRFAVGKSLYELGKIYYDKSDMISAEKYFEESFKCLEAPKDAFSMFKVLGFLIRIASEKLDKEKGENYIAQATTLIQEMTQTGIPLGAEYFYNVGIVENYCGNFDKAGDNYRIAYDKSKDLDLALFSKCILSLAINYYNKGEYESALKSIEELDDVLKKNKKFYILGAMYFYSARIYMKLNQHERALKCFSQANKILHDKKCWNLYGYILLGKGIIYKRMDNYALALTFFNLAKESADQSIFKRLLKLIGEEVEEVQDASVDMWLDRDRRVVVEKSLGKIDFKHRFILLEILFLLANNQKQVFNKEQLADYIWKEEYNPLIHDKLIYTSISRLRKLIEPTARANEKRKYIIRGKDGYSFNANVKVRFQSEDSAIGNVDISSPL